MERPRLEARTMVYRILQKSTQEKIGAWTRMAERARSGSRYHL